MKEIKEYFKNENYECNLLITDKSLDIGLSGNDESTNELILEFYSFDEAFELLEYLKRTTSGKLSVFTHELNSYFKRVNRFSKIPKENSTY